MNIVLKRVLISFIFIFGFILIYFILNNEIKKNEFKLLIDPAYKKCLPYVIYYKSKKLNQVELQKYDLVMLRLQGFEPYISPQQNIGKIIIGMEGDKVQIKQGELRINNIYYGNVSYGAQFLNKPMDFWDTEYQINKDELFLFGTEKETYDSRYIGTIHKNKVISRVGIIM